MAELSADEAQRLARQFLTGKASPADVTRLSVALPEDQTLALELLAQMQAALDDVAPSALNAEQDRSVDARIEALIAPRIKKRGFFGWLRKLFGAKPSGTQPNRRRTRNDPARREPEPELPPPVSAAPVEDGLEETMPGAAAAPEPEAPASRPERRVERAAPASGRRASWGPALGIALLVLLLLAGVGWGVRWWLQRPAPVVVQAAPTPVPTPTVTALAGPPQRARAVAGQADEILPAHMPPTTPQPAGQLSPQP